MSEPNALGTDERIRPNMALANDFVRANLDDPSLLDEIPDDAYVYLIPDDDTEMAAASRRGAERTRQQGRYPVYVRTVRRANAVASAAGPGKTPVPVPNE